jgi:hypothetical protein
MSDKPRKAYEVVLPDGRVITMIQLRTGEVRQCMQKAGNLKVESAQAFETALHGLRASIKKIGDMKVNDFDLSGDKLDDEFDMPEIQLLATAWNRIHMPTDEQMRQLEGEAFRAAGGV